MERRKAGRGGKEGGRGEERKTRATENQEEKKNIKRKKEKKLKKTVQDFYILDLLPHKIHRMLSIKIKTLFKTILLCAFIK